MNTGDIIGNRYEIIRPLGNGGFSSVYYGKDLRFGTECAIKVIKNSENETTLLNELNILNSLKYWRLPAVYDLIKTDEIICIVEEYIIGKTLKTYLIEEKRCTEAKAVEIFLQLCDILIYLHEYSTVPIIHRDIKPDNIIIANNGDVRLIDFGSARQYDYGKCNDTQIIGTLGYLAPETVSGEQSDERSDIYSLGITMYQALTGNDPSKPSFVIKRTSDISRALFKIIRKCTMNTPSQRYMSIKETKSALQMLYIKRHRPKRHFAAAVVFSVVLVFNLVLGGLNVYQIMEQKSPFFFDENITLSQSVTELINRKVTIQAFNSQYFSDNLNTDKKLYASSNQITKHELFQLEQIGSNMIAFKAPNGNYLSADGDGKGAITTSGIKPGRSESFYIQYLGIKENGDAFFCVRTLNGYFWTADLSNSGYLYTKSKEMGGGWETFVIKKAD